MEKRVEVLRDVTIRFAGDSGDGMQITGDQFTTTAALIGNDLSTLPDFPAEIRAPAGSLAGVSSFQLHFSSVDIHTPGDACDVLVAMNPAALKVNIPHVKPNGIIIANTDTFKAKNLLQAGYQSNPLEDGSLAKFQIFPVDITGLTAQALKEFDFLTSKEVERCKNFFALGMLFWLFHRPTEFTVQWIQDYFTKRKRPKYIDPNIAALKAGYAHAEAVELFATSYEVKPAALPPGKYRNITGNTAIALGFVAASKKSGLPLFYAGYPITPASTILHELSAFKQFGVKTLQAEDEIAAICASIGASYAGLLSATGSSGPGIALKQEAIGLAVSAELPLVICNIQRSGPSTGMPTKTEQADLFQAIVGRNGECPVPVIAASRPTDCFEAIYEACRIAVTYMTPVIFLSDGYIGHGSEPWQIPNADNLPEIKVCYATDPATFAPYKRDEHTLARPWAIPGTPGLEHRIGGLEKEDVSGNISYDPHNHERMIHLRAEKVARIAQEFPTTPIYGDADGGEVLVVGWGSTYGTIRTAVERQREQGRSVSWVHLRWLNPLPNDLGDILKRYNQILVPELNLGQLLTFLRARYLVPAVGLNKVQGMPFMSSEIDARIEAMF